MDMLWRVCAIGVLCAAVGMIVKPLRGEFGTFVRLGGGIVILLAVFPLLGDVLGETAALFAETEINRYADAMLRSVGIALLTRACTDVCRETGEGMVANGVELAGKLAILTLCLPMIREIIGYATQILQETEL